VTEVLLVHHARGLTNGVHAWAAEPPSAGVMYAGLSLGVLPAQLLAQTRAGARGALLLHGCVPPEELGSPWPDNLPVQVHMMDADPLALPPNEDLEAARRLDATVAGAELFLHPGEGHLFTDPGGPDHDARAAALVTERVLAFLDQVG
jgi:dienelactone hydrolase